MKHFQNPILLYFILMLCPNVRAQDGTKTLSAPELVRIVRTFHPAAQQANNNIEQAKAGVVAARAFFDPVLQTYIAEKVFDGKPYYRYTQPQLTIPTWYGIELYAGANYVAGERTAPEETLGRTSYAGMAVPLLKDLLMDKRRATLQQAKILQQQSEAEKRSVLNDLLRDALQVYWDWVQQHRLKAVIDSLVTVNEKRLTLVKTAYQLGDRPAIDTVEALAQLQTFLSLRQEQHLAVQNAALNLSFFLWQERSTPYLLPPDVQPAPFIQTKAPVLLPTMDSLLHLAQLNHPELQQYKYKLASLGVEQRLKFQNLLPKLDVRYNQLGPGYNVLKTAAAPVLNNHYQYGISFSLPLRLSEGRGAYRQTRLKIQNLELEVAQKTVLIQNKVKASGNKLQTLHALIGLQQNNLENFRALQRAEELRFATGESSLFLINSRENKVLEAVQKLIELQTKWAQASIELKWAAGSLYNPY